MAPRVPCLFYLCNTRHDITHTRFFALSGIAMLLGVPDTTPEFHSEAWVLEQRGSVLLNSGHLFSSGVCHVKNGENQIVKRNVDPHTPYNGTSDN